MVRACATQLLSNHTEKHIRKARRGGCKRERKGEREEKKEGRKGEGRKEKAREPEDGRVPMVVAGIGMAAREALSGERRGRGAKDGASAKRQKGVRRKKTAVGSASLPCPLAVILLALSSYRWSHSLFGCCLCRPGVWTGQTGAALGPKKLTALLLLALVTSEASRSFLLSPAACCDVAVSL